MQMTNFSILPDGMETWCCGEKLLPFLPFSAARSCVRSDMFEYCKNGSDVFVATPNTPDIFTVSEHKEGSQVCHVFVSGLASLLFAKTCHVSAFGTFEGNTSCCVYIWLSGPCTQSNN